MDTQSTIFQSTPILLRASTVLPSCRPITNALPCRMEQLFGPQHLRHTKEHECSTLFWNNARRPYPLTVPLSWVLNIDVSVGSCGSNSHVRKWLLWKERPCYFFDIFSPMTAVIKWLCCAKIYKPASLISDFSFSIWEGSLKATVYLLWEINPEFQLR